MSTSSNKWSYAVVLDGLAWTNSADSVGLGPGISLTRVRPGLSVRFPGSPADSPANPTERFDAIAWLGPPVPDLHYSTPVSTLEVLVDLIVVMIGAPLHGYRIIPFREEYFRDQALQINVIKDGGQTGFLLNRRTLDDEALADVVQGWQTLAALDKAHRRNGRITSALELFQQAWMSGFMVHTCLSLDLVFRMLVGRETSRKCDEDVASAVTRLAKSLSCSSVRTRELVLRTLGLRTSIFTNGRADQDELFDFGPAAFHLATGLLRQILLTEDVAMAIDARA